MKLGRLFQITIPMSFLAHLYMWKGENFGQRIWDKVRCYWEHPMKTHWKLGEPKWEPENIIRNTPLPPAHMWLQDNTMHELVVYAILLHITKKEGPQNDEMCGVWTQNIRPQLTRSPMGMDGLWTGNIFSLNSWPMVNDIN